MTTRPASPARLIKVLTVGPVPPEWGGPNAGGVANFHRMLLTGLGDHADLEVTTITQGAPPVMVLDPPGHDEQQWYRAQAEQHDVVVMLHVAHRWATYHARERPCPAIGAIRSWTPALTKPDAHQRIQAAMDAMDALVLPSRHSVEQGLELGFRYAVEPTVVRNGLSSVFCEPVDLRRPRTGVVFVGSQNEVKRPWLASAACERLNVPLEFVTGQPQRVVRSALLRAAALCVPSSSEAYGNVYVEAAACGTPSVGYAPAIEELGRLAGIPIGTGVDGDAEVTDLERALERALSATWDRPRLRDQAIANFDASAMVEIYLRLVRSVAARG